MGGKPKKAPAKGGKKTTEQIALEGAEAVDDIFDDEYKKTLRLECRNLEKLIKKEEDLIGLAAELAAAEEHNEALLERVRRHEERAAEAERALAASYTAAAGLRAQLSDAQRAARESGRGHGHGRVRCGVSRPSRPSCSRRGRRDVGGNAVVVASVVHRHR